MGRYIGFEEREARAQRIATMIRCARTVRGLDGAELTVDGGGEAQVVLSLRRTESGRSNVETIRLGWWEVEALRTMLDSCNLPEPAPEPEPVEEGSAA